MDEGARRRRSGHPGLGLVTLSRSLRQILVVNAGSTSLKLSLVDADETSTVVDDFARADAVGHRIVHSGELALEAGVIDDRLLTFVEAAAEIAPLHNRPALAAIAQAREALPDVPHVAVSDSHFHRSMLPEAREYAVPENWRTGYGIVRHGFHGLAVSWVAERVAVARLVVCHLGGGCSVTAVAEGRSIDTTMGLTPLEGPPMGTRSGSFDPGALLYLVRRGLDVDELDRALNEESGLSALGGLDDPFAFAHFTYHVAKAVAAMSAALGGLDALAFSGGIGENRNDVRRAIVARVAHLGEFRVEVVEPREDVMIARAVRAVLDR
jgi:acetate kinase